MITPRVPDSVYLQWQKWLSSGEKSLSEMAIELGMYTPDGRPHRKAVAKRYYRWLAKYAEILPSDPNTGQHDAQEEDRTQALKRLLEGLMLTQSNLEDLDDTKPILSIDLKEEAPVMLVFFSDQHIGGVGTDHRLIVEDYKIVQQEEGVYAFTLGDEVDNFSPAVIPKGMLEQVVGPEYQWELAEMIFKEYLVPKLKGAVDGNHNAFSQAVGIDMTKAMWRRLGVPYLGSGGRVWIVLGGESYKMELRHKFIYNSSLNTTNSQRRLSELVFGADVVCFGDRHFPDLQYPNRAGVDQVWLQCGTYKLRDKYAEGKGLKLSYSPAVPDMPCVILWPTKHKALPFRSFHDGLVYFRAIRKGV